jgi:signal transduction histidine kinase
VTGHRREEAGGSAAGAGRRTGVPPGGAVPRRPLHVREMRTEDDVFASRRLARNAAAALGLDTQDQVRFATALSEVARDMLRVGGARIAFNLDNSGAFTVALTTDRPLPASAAETPGLAAARRLVDQVELATLPGTRTVVTLTRRLPLPGVPDDQRRSVREALRDVTARSPLEELRAQNSDLLLALEELQAKQQELVRLNEELEDTNKGVLALYGELSAELEETNRGVVALYAELDERGVLLQQASEAKNRFLRSVSHELRTPVNSIVGLARLLLDPRAELAGEQRRQVELIDGSAWELLGRINQLLDIARAESGRIDPTWAEVDLRQLFNGLRGRLRPLVADGVALVIDSPPETGPDGIGPVRSDEGLLRDILHNLLGNAAKFTTRGQITLRAAVAPTGDRVLISVQDTGIGIPAEEHERIFDEFYQVPGPAQARVKGTGLGLPYARRLAGILGGGLLMTSQPGAGSTFTVWLPYRAAPLRQPAPGSIPVALVVDDDPAYREVMQGLLHSWAGNILHAPDVPHALALLRGTVPSVVLLDIGLPGTDGTALLAAMAADPRLRTVPVVVVTAADLSAPGLGTSLAAAAAVVAKSDLTEALLGQVLSRVVRA